MKDRAFRFMTRLLGATVAAVMTGALLYPVGYYVLCKEVVQFGQTRVRACESQLLRNIYRPAVECESVFTGLTVQLVAREELICQ